MAADLGWMAGHTSSLEITIISILFLTVYVTLCTLCSICFRYRQTPECPEERETPSSRSLTVNQGGDGDTHRSYMDVLSSMVPPEPQNKSHTSVYSQQTSIYSHNRANSDSDFSQQKTPRILHTPVLSDRSTRSVSPKLPPLPPIPPIFNFNTVQVEQPMASPSQQQPITVKTMWECVTPPPEVQQNMNNRFTGTVSEEHLYACIDNMRVSEPSSSSPSDVTDEERWTSESPYHTVREWTEATCTDVTATICPVTNSEKVEEMKFLFPSLPGVEDDQASVNTDTTAIYAAVNRKKKNQKSIEETLQDTVSSSVQDEDEAPPVPEKNI